MDDATRIEFLQRIKRDVLDLSKHDQDVMKHTMTVVMQMASDARLGSLTLLTPNEEAVARIDTDDALTPDLCESLLGLFLDQIILGKLDPAGQGQFATLGGASAVLSQDDGKLFLTDVHGRRVAVSDPVMDQPKFSWRIADDFLMLDEWERP